MRFSCANPNMAWQIRAHDGSLKCDPRGQSFSADQENICNTQEVKSIVCLYLTINPVYLFGQKGIVLSGQSRAQVEDQGSTKRYMVVRAAAPLHHITQRTHHL